MSDRLDLIRQLDTTRRWESLDDGVCLLCERRFAGRHVDFTRNGNGHVHLHCPTEGCTATPNEWAYLTDPRVGARDRKPSTPFFGLPATA